MMSFCDTCSIFLELNATGYNLPFLDDSEILIKRLSVVCTERLIMLYNFGVDFFPNSWINEHLHDELKRRGYFG